MGIIWQLVKTVESQTGPTEVVHAFSQRVLEYQKRVIDIYYDAIGRYIDCTTAGDDFGTQTNRNMTI